MRLWATVSTSSSVTETKLQGHGNGDIECNVSTDLTNTMDSTSISDNLPSIDNLKMPEDFDSIFTIEDANYECVNGNIDITQTEEVENGEIFQEDTQPGPKPRRARTPKGKRENNWVKHPLLPGCNNTCQKSTSSSITFRRQPVLLSINNFGHLVSLNGSNGSILTLPRILSSNIPQVTKKTREKVA